MQKVIMQIIKIINLWRGNKTNKKEYKNKIIKLEERIEELESELDQDPEPPYNWRDDYD